MTFDITTVALVILVNCCFWGLMPLAQYYEARIGRLQIRGTNLPGTRQPFLYLQDFWSMTIGDLIGLPLIQIVFAHAAPAVLASAEHPISHLYLKGAPFLIGGMAGMLCFMNYTKKWHKPDWGSHALGKVSIGGALHCLYFGANASIALSTIIALALVGASGAWWAVGLTGGAIWIICMIRDWRQGHFAQYDWKRAQRMRALEQLARF